MKDLKIQLEEVKEAWNELFFTSFQYLFIAKHFEEDAMAALRKLNRTIKGEE